MSLNRCEQRIYDYLHSHLDERQYWRQKVQSFVRAAPDEPAAAARLDTELWRYYEERSAVAEPFREAVRREGRQRTSMRNLAELLLRLWTDPKSPARGGSAEPSAPFGP